jgi:hypothetical protein
MKLMYSFLLLILLSPLFVNLLGCGAVPVDNRYGGGNPQQKEQPKQQKKFDFAQYSTVPGFYNDPKQLNEAAHIIWYSYDTTKAGLKKLVKVNGYRVQILSTDNFDEADNLKLNVHTRLQSTPVYVEFESPYYKVRVGDLVESNHAYDLSDKLKQLGYQNTLVVQDSVLVTK